MNFNFNDKPEYELNSSLMEEVINNYGIKVQLVLQERVSNDQVVFGDHSHLFSSDQYEIYALPENSESTDSQEYGYSMFGLEDMNTVSLFIHRNSIQDLPGVEPINVSSRDYSQKMKPNIQDMDLHLVGHLIVLTSGKIMEITHQEHSVPGINNLYSTGNDKSVYKLTCVPYQPKLSNELTSLKDSVNTDNNDFVPDMSLEDYFHELSETKDDQDYEATQNEIQHHIQDSELVSTPLINPGEKQPWE